MKTKTNLITALLLLFFAGCGSGESSHNAHSRHEGAVQNGKAIYTCPMHPQVINDVPGRCPICGMELVERKAGGEQPGEPGLESLVKPTNEFAVSSIPVTTMRKKEEQIEIEALGNIAYDTRYINSIAARVSGRIEKLYLRYRYQEVRKGQRILDIYSPELMTAQDNLLFLLKNDPGNTAFIAAAREKLLLLGMDKQQLQEVERRGTPTGTIAVYSNYKGHIHEGGTAKMNPPPGSSMKDISLITGELGIKEGMYVQKGQTIFDVFDASHAWALLHVYADYQPLVKAGNKVRVVPETAPDKNFRATINFVEPFYQQGSKTLAVRVWFDNSRLEIPMGSQVRATIFGNTKDAYWLPKDAVISLGMDKAVFLKTGDGFRAHRVNTGMIYKDYVQVTGGLNAADSVAVNAQYLMDSESFIKVKN